MLFPEIDLLPSDHSRMSSVNTLLRKLYSMTIKVVLYDSTRFIAWIRLYHSYTSNEVPEMHEIVLGTSNHTNLEKLIHRYLR